ncbi:MAG: PRC-barrel domain-containing protein [Bryobacteraceae bacterium]|jgi:sporulation protein YlmC with PRC-barrel domain
MGPRPRILSATAIVGDKVVSTSDEDLGKIEELMIDLDRGSIAYAVLSFGGFLGIGDKLFAVPWSAFRLELEKGHFILDVDRAVLEKAPGFDKDNWPDMADRNWAAKLHRHYGSRPYWDNV